MEVKLNPNTTLVNNIRKALKDNGGYCPCKLLINEDTKCMCKEFRDMMDRGESGMCHCGLYVIENND